MTSMRFALLVASLVVASSCSSRDRPTPPRWSIPPDVAPSLDGMMDKSIARKSAAFHNFLVGQLKLYREDFDGARDSFSRASDLVEGDAPELHLRLAELNVRGGDLTAAKKECENVLTQQPDNVQARLLYGGVLESLELDKEAEEQYRIVLAKDSKSNQAGLLLASLYLRGNRVEESITVLQRMIARDATDAAAHYYLGRALEEKADYKSAEKSLRTALRLNAEAEEIPVDILRVLLKAKRFSEAKQFAEELLKKDPRNNTARRVVSELLINESKFAEALQQLEALEESEEDPTETRFRMALINISRQSFVDAVRDLTLVLARRPDHDVARYYLASIYAGSGQRKDALAELRKIEPAQEMFSKARTFAAFLLRQEGEHQQAAEAVQEALKSDPANKGMVLYLVLILREGKLYADAEKVIVDALRDDPKNEKLHYHHGLLLHSLKREPEAVAAMEQALALNPANEQALNYIAYHLADEGVNLDRAFELISRALKQNPTDGYFLDTLGWVLFKQKKIEQAVEVLGRATTATGYDIVVAEHYGHALIASGRHADAFQVLTLSASRADRSDTESEQYAALQRVEKQISELMKKFPELRASSRAPQ